MLKLPEELPQEAPALPEAAPGNALAARLRVMMRPEAPQLGAPEQPPQEAPMRAWSQEAQLSWDGRLPPVVLLPFFQPEDELLPALPHVALPTERQLLCAA